MNIDHIKDNLHHTLLEIAKKIQETENLIKDDEVIKFINLVLS